MLQSGGVRIAARTLWNWLLDMTVLVSAVLAALSGIYFLFLPNGSQGGRNPYYGIVILFERSVWTNIHIWSGVIMVVALLVHLIIHLDWIGMMGRKITASWRKRSTPLSKGARTNVLVDLGVAVSFLICAASGIYFLFAPAGGYQGGANPAWDPGFLFSRLTWDLIHTWSGIALILAALGHIAIHWLWISKVSAKISRVLGGMLLPQPSRTRSTAQVE